MLARSHDRGVPAHLLVKHIANRARVHAAIKAHSGTDLPVERPTAEPTAIGLEDTASGADGRSGNTRAVPLAVSGVGADAYIPDQLHMQRWS